VVLKSKDDYHAMVDAWSSQDTVKNLARRFSSVFIDNFRCGYEGDFLNVLSLAIADTVSRNVSLSFRTQDALLEGLHSYLSGLMCLRYQTYVSAEVTTPDSRHVSSITFLCETAKEYLSRPRRDNLEQILSCELNALNPEKLSVSFALVQFLLEKRMDRWKAFCKVLEAESLEDGKLKGPEGRRAALSKAVQEGLGITFEELDKQVQAFTSKEYLYPEEIATAIGLNRETEDSIFQGFVQVCELKRAKKPVTPKGEKLYDEMMKKVDKIIQERGEKW
jgi:hypothetical protein